MTPTTKPLSVQPLAVPIRRRSFFRYATAGAAALGLASCSKDVANAPAVVLPAGNSTNSNGSINLGAGDVGVLNFAYALEQLEADFYARVAALPAGLLSGSEYAYFQQVAKHEAIHRDLLLAVLTRNAGPQVLRALTPTYPAATFGSRASILTTARTFEDLGVAAYNGAARLFKSAAYLDLAGQLVSVEARHAAYLRNLVAPGSFAADDQVNTTGLDKAIAPVEVVNAAQPYLTEKLDASYVGVNPI